MKIRIWGARGSIPSPLKPEDVEEKICQAIFGMPDIDTADLRAVQSYVRQLPPLSRGTAGGNTTCIEIQAGGETFIIDAGSGIRELGLELMKGPCGHGQGTLHLFFSHPHWDHIQGFPFFMPAFVSGNQINIYSVHNLKTALNDQQRPFNFPVSVADMRANIQFTSLQVGQPFRLGSIRINTIENAHPGKAYSFRFENQHSVFVHASDSEYKYLDEASVQPHIDFFRNADALTFDAQYTLKDAWHKVDWGHSSALIGVDLARAAGVKKLILFHHDPTYSDRELQEIQSTAIAYQAQDTSRPICEVIVAYEGLAIDITPPGAVDLQLTASGEAAVLTPTSVFDEHGVDQLAVRLAHLAESDVRASPVIDLSQVDKLTTSSLKSLVMLSQRQKEAGIVVAAPSVRVQEIIELGGFSDYFAIYPSVEVALAAVQARESLNLPGHIIKDRYQIINEVGKGRFGTVVKATDIPSGHPVALKILSPAFSDETINGFMRQAQQVTSLNHRNIAKMIAWDQVGNHHFLVEEFIAGQTLQDLLTAGVEISTDQAMDITLNINLALDYAHNRGVIHSDLKPQNIFVTDEGIKLSGFGLGRLAEGRCLLDAPMLHSKAAYLSPEQILGQPLDARTDLYAVGVILYQLLTGHLPFEGTDQEVMEAHLSHAPPSPRELNPDISLALEHLILKLLAKNPNDRYASADQAHDISSNLVDSASEVIRRHREPLFDREKQLLALQTCWKEARAGRGQLAFISGEPGIGKSSLARQAASQSKPPVLLIGRCQELKGSPAYLPFTEILRAYFATVPPELLDEEVHRLLGNFSRLVPQIRRVLPNLSDLPPLEPEQEQLRLIASLTQFIRKATQKRPWLLILEDLQWADQSSLELLRYLGYHLPSITLMIIGTYRDVELERGHALFETLRDLSSQPTYTHLHLDRLDQPGVDQILSNIWQQPPPKDLSEKIYRHTDGNPFYVEELARGLVDDGLVTFQDGAWHFAAFDEVRLPQTVREAVWSRVRHLGTDTQNLLSQAAVLGQTFHFDDLRAMSGLSEWEVLEHLDLALERHLVQETPGESMLRFSHTEIQHVLYEDLGSLRRRMLHRLAGEATERRALPEPELVAEELAHHFGEAGEFERTLVYSIQAARRAEAAFANDGAILWYRRALEILEQHSGDGEATFHSLCVSIHIALGEVLTLVGRYDEALAHYDLARTLLERGMPSADQKHYVIAKLSRNTADVYKRRGEYDTAFQWFERGLGYLNQSGPNIESARLYLDGAVLYLRQGNSDAALPRCQQGLDMASHIASREGQQILARAYYILGNIFSQRGDLAQSVQFCVDSLHIYQQIDDLVGQSIAYLNLGIVYYKQGDWTLAREAYHHSLEIKKKLGDIYGQGQASNNLGNLHLDRGEWELALSLFEESLAIWKEIGATGEEANTLSNLAQLYIYQENWAEAGASLSRSQDLFAEIGSDEFASELERRWGIYYLHTGKLDEALSHTYRSIQLGANYGDLLEQGISCRTLGQVHLARDDIEAAETAFRQSLQILSDLKSEYEMAKTKLSLASLLAETTSRNGAQAYLTQAIKIFERLGAQADLSQARELQNKAFDKLRTQIDLAKA